MTMGAARVIYQINDLSMYLDQIMKGYVIVVAVTERGPLWTPTPVASWDEYERIFGRTILASTDPLQMKMGLLQGAKFIVIRIVHCVDPADPSTMTAQHSTVTLNDQGNIPGAGYIESAAGPFTFTPTAPGSFTGLEVGPFTFGAGVADAMLLQVAGGTDQPVTLTGALQTPQQVADQINAATNGVLADVVNNKLRVSGLGTDNLVIKATAHDAYSVLGLSPGTSMGSFGTGAIAVTIDRGAPQAFFLTPGTGRTAAQVMADLAAMVGAVATVIGGKLRLTSSTTGVASVVQVAGPAATIMGFDAVEHVGTSGATQLTLKFDAANPGEWGDSLRVHVHRADLHPDTLFDVRVSYSQQEGLNEYFTGVSMDPASDRYVADYINQRSRLVKCTDLHSMNAGYSNRPAINDIGTLMTGGDDGLAGLNDADYIGDSLAQTGMYAANKSVSSAMSIDIMILGTSSISVLQALVAYVENRGDLVAYAAFPAGLDPEDARKWRMGELPYSHEPFNSHRFVLQYGRVLCYDSRFDRRFWIPVLGHFASVLAKTTEHYSYSHAPAGPRRGTVDFVEAIDWNLGDYPGYQDMFAEYGMDYLMISRQIGIEGAVFWEQYTTQRAASALRELGVVRFLTAMRMVLMPALRMFIQEPNHPASWRELHRELEPQFKVWQQRNNIYAYKLQTDRDAYFDDNGELKNAVINDGLSIDQGIYNARVLVQPTRAMRYLQFTVGVMRTGENFKEYESLKELPGVWKS